MTTKKDYLLYCLSVFFITVWTLLRYSTHSSVYDLVTQQLVARQWLHGNFNPITLGTTHYIFKTIFIYIPAEIMPGSPRAKLIIVNLFINILTFVLITVLLHKILKILKVKQKNVSVSVVWLAMIAGSAFWISYANSRNLEVVGGLYLIYCVLKVGDYQKKTYYVWLALFSGILFFVDTLQLFMTALPLLVYILLVQRKHFYKLAITFLAGLFVSKFLFYLAHHILHVTFSGTGVARGPIDIVGASRSTVTLFAGSMDAGWFRVALNLLCILSVSCVFLYQYKKGKIPRKLGQLVLTFVICNELIYIVSGQAHESHTSRYLIMLVPMGMLIIASVCNFMTHKAVFAAIGILISFNAVALSLALVKNWDIKFNKDSHMHSVARYINRHHLSYAYASMDTALPLAYFQEAHTTRITALACAAPRLVKAKSVPALKNQASGLQQVGLFLDGSHIANYPAVCTVENIKSQLGQPISADVTDDGSTVLFYTAEKLNSLRF